MTGSRKNTSTENASPLNDKFFMDPPDVSKVDLEKRIDVAAYWLVREHLAVKDVDYLMFIKAANFLKVEITDNYNWPGTELPYFYVAFWPGYAEAISTNGEVDTYGKDGCVVQKLEYADPNLTDNVVKVIRDWYQKVIDSKRYPEAIGSPQEVIYGNC